MALLLAAAIALSPASGDCRVTWFGPGLWGNTMACGGTLHRRTVGVASLALACGTRVRFAWRGHRITLTVIDRTGGGRWDMTRRAMHLFVGRPRTLDGVAWRVVP